MEAAKKRDAAMDSDYANLMNELSGGPKKQSGVPAAPTQAAAPWARPDLSAFAVVAPPPGMEGK